MTPLSQPEPGEFIERRSRPKRRGLWALMFASMMLLVVLPAPPAEAATSNNGVCEVGEVCYYYNSDRSGSMRDFTSRLLPTYFDSTGACYKFKTAGLGQGKCVKNNAASVWNRKNAKISVYYYSKYGAPFQSFPAGASGNLYSWLKNENASQSTDTAPFYEAWEDTLVGVGHYARVTFRASDFYNGRHVKRVYVRLTRLNCKFYPDADTGRVYSVYAGSPSDTSYHSISAQMNDSPLGSCTIRSYWGVEYF